MAKVTINGIEFEGTPIELMELVSLSKVSEKSKEVPNKPEPRKYKVGDVVRITRYQCGPEVGEELEVKDVYGTTVTFEGHYVADFDAIELVTPTEARF